MCKKDWEDVPLRLETATPTYQVGLPSLSPWTLSIFHPIPMPPPGAARAIRSRSVVPQMMMMRKSVASTFGGVDVDADEESAELEMLPRAATVTSKGNVSATFDVPGIITIPSDGAAHNVNIIKLNLEAIMSWVAVPKYDARTRLNVLSLPSSYPNGTLTTCVGKDQERVRVYSTQWDRQHLCRRKLHIQVEHSRREPRRKLRLRSWPRPRHPYYISSSFQENGQVRILHKDKCHLVHSAYFGS